MKLPLPSPDELRAAARTDVRTFLHDALDRIRVAAACLDEALHAPEPLPDESLVDIVEAAALTGRSVSWFEKRGHTVPGFSQPGGKGTKKHWRKRELLSWGRT